MKWKWGVPDGDQGHQMPSVQQPFPVLHGALALAQASKRAEHDLFAIVHGIPAGFGDVVVADVVVAHADREKVAAFGKNTGMSRLHVAITCGRRAGSGFILAVPSIVALICRRPGGKTMSVSVTKKPADLRSARWFAPDDLRAFGHRSRAMQMGYGPEDWVGKPVIAILNTWSEAQPCHMHFKSRVDDVKRGILQAGGFPMELPALSLSESFLKPTTMLYRNLLAMDAEELLRGHPVDGVVLMGGCDKTTPALLLGAISMNIPAIYLPAGPMLRGNWKGKVLGSGSDAWKYWDERRAGKISDDDWVDVEAGIARSYGTCMTMGTAATMMAMAETLGMSLPGSSSIPAADANHIRMAAETGRRIVDMVWEDLTPKKILGKQAFLNAITVAMAVGCSTNAIIHLIALARRAGHDDVGLDDFERASRKVPVIANIRPSGDKYLMEDFFYAGGLPGLLEQIRDHLHLDVLTVTGKTLGDNVKGAEVYNDDVIRPVKNPIYKEGALAVLKGNLAPDGCVIKPSACAPKFLKHTGPALVFDDYPSMKAAIDRDDLDVTEDTILILRNAGPQGGPGMPEWGMLPIPKKLVQQGVRDMVRLSDSRMSGTSYGACILHVSPESYIGGPLALVKTGDMISLDVDKRTINMNVSDAELAKRKAAWKKPEPRYERGYGWMFTRHIKQANEGCDFDFLETRFGAPVAEPSIY
jgi:dihydroxy-acid dehydratase